MKEKGWVDFEIVRQDESPNKKVYSLTEAGRDELRNWLSEPGKSSGSHNAFLAQLHFSDAIPIEAQLRVLEERRISLMDDLVELESRAKKFEMPVPLPVDALQTGLGRELFSLEYGIRSYQFEIAWTENIIAILANALPGRETQ